MLFHEIHEFPTSYSKGFLQYYLNSIQTEKEHD